MSIHVDPSDDDPDSITVSGEDGETIIVSNDDDSPDLIVATTEDPAPDVVFVEDGDEAPDVIFVTEDDTAPIDVGQDDPQVIEVDEGPGPRGLQGVPGMSAYDVAVMEGFVGTEDQWLASLVGPQGTPGSAPQAYVHDQGVPSAVWTIPHNLGYHPNVTVIDSGGNEWLGEVAHQSDDVMVITFDVAFGGKAYLS